MKSVLAALAACTLATAAIAAEPAGPADKADSGSLSSGAKEASPSTKMKGENRPVGNDASSGTSAGDSGADDDKPALKKPMTSDPAGGK